MLFYVSRWNNQDTMCWYNLWALDVLVDRFLKKKFWQRQASYFPQHPGLCIHKQPKTDNSKKLKPDLASKLLHLCETASGLSGHCVWVCVWGFKCCQHFSSSYVWPSTTLAQQQNGQSEHLAGVSDKRTPSWGSKNQVYAEKGHTLTSALQATLPQHELDWQMSISV